MSQHFGGLVGPTGDVQSLANYLGSLYQRDLIVKPEFFSIGKSIDSHLQSIMEYAKKCICVNVKVKFKSAII